MKIAFAILGIFLAVAFTLWACCVVASNDDDWWGRE